MCLRIAWVVFVAALFPSEVHSDPAKENKENCAQYRGITPALLLAGQEQRLNNMFSSIEYAQPFAVSFGAYVLEQGRIQNPCCVETTARLPSMRVGTFLRSIAALKFVPAAIGTQKVRVFINPTLVITRTESGNVMVDFLPNQAVWNKKQYKTDIAPQRIGRFGMQYTATQTFRVTGRVGMDGRISKVTNTAARNKKGAKIRRKMMQRMKQSCFVPGRRNGQPIDMDYQEIFER